MSNQIIRANAFASSDTAKTPKGKVSVGETSTEVAAANLGRVSLTICNDSTAIVYVAKGPTAVKEEGIRLNKEGGSIVIDDYTGKVTAIATGAASNVSFTEV